MFNIFYEINQKYLEKEISQHNGQVLKLIPNRWFQPLINTIIQLECVTSYLMQVHLSMYQWWLPLDGESQQGDFTALSVHKSLLLLSRPLYKFSIVKEQNPVQTKIDTQFVEQTTGV